MDAAWMEARHVFPTAVRAVAAAGAVDAVDRQQHRRGAHLPPHATAAVAGPNAAQANYQNLAVPSVYSYSKTGGLFVGAMVGGLGITIDEKLNNTVYGNRSPREILSGSVPAPAGGIAYAAQLDSMGQFRPTLATEIAGDAPE